jgi:hypothetical protein
MDIRAQLAKFTAPFMKNDSTTTFLNFVLAALVILGVVFALLTIWRTRDLRRVQIQVQAQMQRSQITTARAQSLLNETITFNTTARSAELAQIIQSAQNPPPPAAK